ncbi:GGDEF domain-containing protein [Neptuniibacter caesariensis]|uniref:Signaling protein (EAL,CBS,GGDEF domains) n=1 Tax=Neptuniibacter caesariensis TaxID=207954 RepID=A0A7U8GU31_NEPCE|nr:GGDEF domain-containing protein [Neptuniibacter caesariensis]EAR62968.1 Signaling protein (EAL,CBS,GGDEF domains) [Oceanospirillum sp. MED92] [Neptuniibacter caesariensis]
MLPSTDEVGADTRRQLLLEILETESLFPHFQPIVDMKKNEVIGHEALIRGPAGSVMASPGALFQTAIENNLLHTLELLCRRFAIEKFAELKPGGKLFLNISASLLGTPEHTEGFTSELLQELGISIQDIVIELSEQHPFDQHGLTNSAVQYYRNMGFQVAVDDLGTGYSGLKLWSELNPEYVKIDRHFVSRIDTDAVKREFVRSICNISSAMGCKVIAEGIERREEVQTLMELGISIGQGFYLGYPSPEPQPTWTPLAINEIQVAESIAESETNETALALLRQAPAVAPDDTVLAVSELFRANSDMSALAVVQDGIPLGVVRKSDLLELFSTQYGRALYEKKPASRILSDDVLLVENDMSLVDVSRLVTGQEHSALQQDIIITQDGCYLGMGNLRDLLKRITELKIQNARYANPLTLLPGNVPINQELEALLKRTADFYVAYFDLNNFKPFNDSYGYSKGDQVIRLLGELLTCHASHANNFIGHIGGDDFVVIFRSPDWQMSCERILREFDKEVRGFYSPKDLQNEGLWSTDRKGVRSFFPLLGLAIGVVHPDPYRCGSFHEVAELAAMAKKEAKKHTHSALFVSRRRTTGLSVSGSDDKRQA